MGHLVECARKRGVLLRRAPPARRVLVQRGEVPEEGFDVRAARVPQHVLHRAQVRAVGVGIAPVAPPVCQRADVALARSQNFGRLLGREERAGPQLLELLPEWHALELGLAQPVGVKEEDITVLKGFGELVVEWDQRGEGRRREDRAAAAHDGARTHAARPGARDPIW